MMTHCAIDKSTPKIDIRSQLAADEIVVFHRCVMQGHCGLEELVFASTAETFPVSAMQ